MILAATTMAQSQEEKNKTVVERFLKAYMECDLNTIAETVSKEVKMYSFGEFWLDYDGLINVTKEKKGTAEKISYEEWVVEDNKVVAKWTSFWKSGVYRGVTLGVIEDGKIIEWWAYFKKTGETGETGEMY
jgi:limonene-1,2-epoxide hydrolase